MPTKIFTKFYGHIHWSPWYKLVYKYLPKICKYHCIFDYLIHSYFVFYYYLFVIIFLNCSTYICCKEERNQRTLDKDQGRQHHHVLQEETRINGPTEVRVVLTSGYQHGQWVVYVCMRVHNFTHFIMVGILSYNYRHL